MLAALFALYFPTLVAHLQSGSLRVDERYITPIIQPLRPLIGDINQSIPTPTGPKPLPIVVAEMMNRYLSQFTTQYPILISLLLSVSLYLTLWVFVPLILWPTLIIILGWIWLFRATNLIRVEVRNEPVEHITL